VWAKLIPAVRNFVELLTGHWDRVGQVDDVKDLGAAEAGESDSTHPGRV
jgi:hypothetical protein